MRTPNTSPFLAATLALLIPHAPPAGAADGEATGRFTNTQSWSQENNYPRPFWVQVPPAEKTGAPDPPRPVLIALHGNGGDPEKLRQHLNRRYPRIAQQFITVFPEGYRKSWNIVSERSAADDRGFIEAIVRKLAAWDNVRAGAFTVMGISNGAALANQIAIESPLPDIKNIVTSVSQLNTFQHDGDHFKAKGDDNRYRTVAEPPAGRRILNISGTADRLVPYTGGPSPVIPANGGKLPFVDAEESIFLWAKQMGYRGEKLAAPTSSGGGIERFSYLDGDVVHLKANAHGHNATDALTEKQLLDFLLPEKN